MGDEMTKSLNEATAAEQAAISAFDQLVAANPILTEISDCMTGEGNALAAGEADAAGEWGRRKEQANRALAECSQKYNSLMATLREAGW